MVHVAIVYTGVFARHAHAAAKRQYDVMHLDVQVLNRQDDLKVVPFGIDRLRRQYKCANQAKNRLTILRKLQSERQSISFRLVGRLDIIVYAPLPFKQ